MVRSIVLATIALLTGSALAADSPKDTVTAAAKKLGDAANYSWKTTSEFGGQARGGSEGKTEKDGFTVLTFTFGDNTTEVYIKGTKGAIKTADGWQSLDEAAKAEQGPGRFVGRMAQTFKAPAAQAAELAAATKELKQADDVISGDLTEEGAKNLMAFGGGRGGANAPAITNAKGTVKFWVKDGVLTKMQYSVTGTRGDRDIDRSTTVEIKDVGTTKIAVPEEATKKMQ